MYFLCYSILITTVDGQAGGVRYQRNPSVIQGCQNIGSISRKMSLEVGEVLASRNQRSPRNLAALVDY